jgi:hypothetical protein
VTEDGVSERRVTTMAELTAHDLGRAVSFTEPDGTAREGVLARVLHEGGPSGIQPTAIRYFTAGLTESTIGRYDGTTEIVVEPHEVDVIDAVE